MDFYEEKGDAATLTLGHDGLRGHLVVSALVYNPAQGEVMEELVVIDLETMTARMGSERDDGPAMTLDLRNIVIDARSSSISIRSGGRRAPAMLIMQNRSDETAIFANGDAGHLDVGGRESSGVLRVLDGSRRVRFSAVADTGVVTVGGAGDPGAVLLRVGEQANAERVKLHAVDGLEMLSDAFSPIITASAEDGTVTVGGVGQAGTLTINDAGGGTRIEMTGDDGDIRFTGADLAEEFTAAPQAAALAAPGMVMVLDQAGDMVPCEQVEDPRVLGAIAGAGSYHPAMILDRQAGPDRHPIAMIGKVFVQVTAAAGPIAIGDLLTTSATLGHAQIAGDTPRPGTVIGKALGTLDQGTGLIPVLINLR